MGIRPHPSGAGGESFASQLRLVRRTRFPPMKALQILSFLAAVAATVTLVTTAQAATQVGGMAPDFTLTDNDGQPRTLSEYRGRTVVLEWHNPDCPIVRKHYGSGNMPATQRAAEADGVVWLTINSGAPGSQGADYSREELAAYLKRTGAAPTAYLRDPDGTVGRQYGAKTTPHLFIVDGAGTLVYAGAIDSIRSSDPADIKRATNYVTAALADLKAGRPVATAATQPYGCSVHY